MPVTATLINGAINVVSGRQALAAAGAYYSCTNATIGTGVAYAAVSAWSATANGFLVVQNKNPSGGKSIYFDRLQMIQTATAPVATAIRGEVYNETGIVVGTTAVVTTVPVQINTAGGQATGAVVQSFNAGAITIPAAVGTRVVQGQFFASCGVQVVKDITIIDFGTDGPALPVRGGAAARATDTGLVTGYGPPVVVAPGTTSWINLWGFATNAPTFEWVFTYVEL
jgi:hypothetical protein